MTLNVNLQQGLYNLNFIKLLHNDIGQKLFITQPWMVSNCAGHKKGRSLLMDNGVLTWLLANSNIAQRYTFTFILLLSYLHKLNL